MRLVEVALENFRGYGARTVLPVDDLTVLVGKNDVGKSTFLEALNIVLAEGKADASDIHVHAANGTKVSIECAFDELPPKLTLDAGSSTSIADEYLTRSDGRLHLRWTYDVNGTGSERKLGKPQVKLVAMHPTGDGVSDLHSKKNAELKKLVKDARIEAQCDLNNNASMRKALWVQADEVGQLERKELELDLAKEDGKSILSQIQAALPMYVLFRADRPSTDQDAEVQDPMKVAVRTALDELRTEVDAMKERVKKRTLEVATRTLGSLHEFDPALADSLTPEFADPKLDSAFKLTLLGDDGIAVNKRGSGVRRLVLFSFFRAEAERRQSETSGRGIIYAVEEPETAQHPDFQRRVVDVLRSLSETDACQVVVTTHSPGLARLLPTDSLRLIRKTSGVPTVEAPTEATLNAIASELGVLPEYASQSARPSVLVVLEGPNDVFVVRHLASLWRDAGLPAPVHEVDCVFVPAGGQDLKNWVEHRYLKSLGLREVHIYDRDPDSNAPPKPKYQSAVDEVNSRNDGSTGFLTNKQAMENYFHWDAVIEAAYKKLSIQISVGPWTDTDDVVGMCTAVLKGNRLPCNCKAWINRHAVEHLTMQHVRERGAEPEITVWFTAILGQGVVISASAKD